MEYKLSPNKRRQRSHTHVHTLTHTHIHTHARTIAKLRITGLGVESEATSILVHQSILPEQKQKQKPRQCMQRSAAGLKEGTVGGQLTYSACP